MAWELIFKRDDKYAASHFVVVFSRALIFLVPACTLNAAAQFWIFGAIAFGSLARVAFQHSTTIPKLSTVDSARVQQTAQPEFYGHGLKGSREWSWWYSPA